MIAILQTLCGCVKTMRIQELQKSIVVPLMPLELGMFDDSKDPEYMPPEQRTRVFTYRGRNLAGNPIYREEPKP